MIKTKSIASIALVASLALVACSDSDDSSGGTNSQDSGNTVEGTGYSITLPEGWEEVPEEEADPETDIMAGHMDTSDEFASNINVIVVDDEEIDLDEAEELAPEEAAANGISEIEMQDRPNIDGVEASHLTGVATQFDGIEVEQFYIPNDGETRIVTIFVNVENDGYEDGKIGKSIMGSWTWQ